MLSCTMQESAKVNVVPYPNSISMKTGTFNAVGASVHYDASFDEMTIKAIARFCDRLSDATGTAASASEGSSRTGIVFMMDPTMAEEAYTLDITAKAVKAMLQDRRRTAFFIQRRTS